MSASAFNEIAELMGKLGMQDVIVPEWGRKVYFYPQAAHEVALSRKLIDPDAPMAELNVALVCIKALTEDGTKMFSPENLGEMLHWKCSKVFDHVAEKMRAATTVAEAKKPSPVTQK
jgi:hypothetical protein